MLAEFGSGEVKVLRFYAAWKCYHCEIKGTVFKAVEFH